MMPCAGTSLFLLQAFRVNASYDRWCGTTAAPRPSACRGVRWCLTRAARNGRYEESTSVPFAEASTVRFRWEGRKLWDGIQGASADLGRMATGALCRRRRSGAWHPLSTPTRRR